MADEITMNLSLNVRKGKLDYQSKPTAVRVNMDGASRGPTPAYITVNQYGSDVDLSQLDTPGICRIMNLSEDDDVWIEYGVWDPETGVFYPFGEALSGEFYILRLSRFLGSEQLGTGTGTGGPATNTLRIKCYGAETCEVLVEAFEK